MGPGSGCQAHVARAMAHPKSPELAVCSPFRGTTCFCSFQPQQLQIQISQTDSCDIVTPAVMKDPMSSMFET